MHRTRKGELARLHRAVVISRLAVDAARGELIEALGDWMCGSDNPPPSAEEIAELARLVEAQEQAEASYASCIAALSEEWVAHARRRRA